MSALPVQAAPRLSLVEKFAGKYNIEAPKLMATLKATAFRVDSGEVSNEQMAALLVVSDQYGLNPFTKEIFAFPDKYKGIVPVVSIDGWARIINEHPQYDGVEFVDGPADGFTPPEYIECVIYRKDRAHPTKIRERFAECRRETGPWKSHPARMLRHKALIQCARIAFGFAGIYDEDEAARIIEHDVTPQKAEAEPKPATQTDAVVAKLRAERTPAPPVDVEVERKEPDPITLQTVLDYIAKAANADQADLALDMGRGKLTDAEYAQAVTVRNERFRETIG